MTGNIHDIHPFIDEKYFYQYAGLTLNEVAVLCDVALKTVKKWRDTNKWPTTAKRLVMLHGGFLAGSGWEQWQLHPADNKLYSPDLRDGFTPQDIESIYYLRRRCEELERRNSAPAQYYLL